MKFTVDRARWRCGGGDAPAKRGVGVTKLLNMSGYMCCLGHIALQLGERSSRLRSAELPAAVLGSAVHLCPVLVDERGANTQLALAAARINDNTLYTQEQREQYLIAEFLRYGHELEFVGEFNDGTETPNEVYD